MEITVKQRPAGTLKNPGAASGPGAYEAGFTYVSLLFVILVIGLALGTTGKIWSTVAKREKEEELVFRGGAVRAGIESYYKRPGLINTYPRSLTDLVSDKRLNKIRRHLRKVYADPMTGKPDWVLLKTPGGRIKGVRSRSEEKTLKKRNFPAGLEELEDKSSYSEWEFVYEARKTEPEK